MKSYWKILDKKKWEPKSFIHLSYAIKVNQYQKQRQIIPKQQIFDIIEAYIVVNNKDLFDATTKRSIRTRIRKGFYLDNKTHSQDENIQFLQNDIEQNLDYYLDSAPKVFPKFALYLTEMWFFHLIYTALSVLFQSIDYQSTFRWKIFISQLMLVGSFLCFINNYHLQTQIFILLSVLFICFEVVRLNSRFKIKDKL